MTIKISQYRMDMGQIPINGAGTIQFTNPPGTSPSASGLIITATVASNGEGVGTPMYVGSNGQFYDASATNNTTAPCVGIALDSGTGSSKRILMHGLILLSSWSWTTGPGDASLVYLATSTGILTQTQPSSTDNVVQPVGWALSNHMLYFCPSMMYFTHI